MLEHFAQVNRVINMHWIENQNYQMNNFVGYFKSNRNYYGEPSRKRNEIITISNELIIILQHLSSQGEFYMFIPVLYSNYEPFKM